MPTCFRALFALVLTLTAQAALAEPSSPAEIALMGVPTVPSAQAGNCGPDITEWLLKDIEIHAKYALDKRERLYLIQRLEAFETQSHYLMAHKWMNFNEDAPGTGRCVETVSIGGVCVTKNVAGDIVFAAIGNLYPPGFPFSNEKLTMTYGYDFVKRYEASHPYADQFKDFVGVQKSYNLAAFGVGHQIANYWDRLEGLPESDRKRIFSALMAWAMNNESVIKTYASLYGEGGKLLNANSLTFLARGEGFNTRSCAPSTAARPVSRPSSMEAFKGILAEKGLTLSDLKVLGDKELDYYLQARYEYYY